MFASTTQGGHKNVVKIKHLKRVVKKRFYIYGYADILQTNRVNAVNANLFRTISMGHCVPPPRHDSLVSRSRSGSVIRIATKI